MSGQHSKDHGVLGEMLQIGLLLTAIGALATLISCPPKLPRAAVGKVVQAGPARNLLVASWYGPKHHGRRTASGEVFDQEAMTYASPTDDFGTLLICELGGRSVKVRCNDRGPFVGGRDLDLSMAAARHLGMLDAGVAIINVRRVE